MSKQKNKYYEKGLNGMNLELRHARCMEIAKVIFGDIAKDQQITVSLNKLQLFHALTIADERENIAEMLDDEDWTYGAALVRAHK